MKMGETKNEKNKIMHVNVTNTHTVTREQNRATNLSVDPKTKLGEKKLK